MTTSGTKIIEAHGVAKRFGDVVALQGCDLEVQEGECLGLLGPNGAGKSTFICCLYGVVERTGGELSVFGFDPAKNARAIKARIGIVPQENALDEASFGFPDSEIEQGIGWEVSVALTECLRGG